MQEKTRENQNWKTEERLQDRMKKEGDCTDFSIKVPRIQVSFLRVQSRKSRTTISTCEKGECQQTPHDAGVTVMTHEKEKENSDVC